MLVDDGFSVLDTEAGILNDRQTVREVQVIKVSTDKIFPNPYQPRKVFDDDALDAFMNMYDAEGLYKALSKMDKEKKLKVVPFQNK